MERGDQFLVDLGRGEIPSTLFTGKLYCNSIIFYISIYFSYLGSDNGNGAV